MLSIIGKPSITNDKTGDPKNTDRNSGDKFKPANDEETPELTNR